MLQDKKTAFIIAGPNGSGKTTFSISLIKNTNILTGMHLNADIILKAHENSDDYKNGYVYLQLMVTDLAKLLANHNETFALALTI